MISTCSSARKTATPSQKVKEMEHEKERGPQQVSSSSARRRPAVQRSRSSSRDRSSGLCVPNLDGKTVRLSSYRNKVNVVLRFGGVTCGATATQLRAGKPSTRALYPLQEERI